jgi:transposase
MSGERKRSAHKRVTAPLLDSRSPPKLVRDIRRATRKQYSAEEKIRIVLDGLRGES